MTSSCELNNVAWVWCCYDVFLCLFQVLKWVEETVQALKVHLLSSNHDSAQENQWEVPFDPSLREVTVSLSGPAPQIELRDPFGTQDIPTMLPFFLDVFGRLTLSVRK